MQKLGIYNKKIIVLYIPCCRCYAECRQLPNVHFPQISCRMSTIGAGVAECGKYFTIGKFLQIVDILHQDFAESGTFADCG